MPGEAQTSSPALRELTRQAWGRGAREREHTGRTARKPVSEALRRELRKNGVQGGFREERKHQPLNPEGFLIHSREFHSVLRVQALGK